MVDEALRERIGLTARGVQQILNLHSGDQMQHGEVEAGPEVDEEVTAEIRAVDPEAAAEPGHDEREQRPQIPVREIRGQRLPPGVRIGGEAPTGEVQLGARHQAEQGPEAKPPEPAAHAAC